MKHLPRGFRSFEIGASIASQTEFELMTGDRALYRIAVPVEQAANGRPDKVGSIGIEPLLHEQVDVTEIHISELNRDLLALAQSGSEFAYIAGSLHHSIPRPSVYHPGRWYSVRFGAVNRIIKSVAGVPLAG